MGVGFLVVNENNRIERGCEEPGKQSQVVYTGYNQKRSNGIIHRINWVGERLEN